MILTVALAFLGNSIAWYDGYFSPAYAVLSFVGLLLAHISVNTLNDYYDYTSGLDLETRRTPFSGGSGILPSGLLKPRQVFWMGVISFLLAVPVGVYFLVVRGLWLLPVLLLGALCILLYTPFILKRRWPEWSPGLGLGMLPILGFYFVQAGAYNWHAVVASIPSGILVHNLLFLNEFPDCEADSKVKRKTLPITMGMKKAGIVYSALTIIIYLWIIGWVVAGIMPVYSLIALLTLPLAVKAIQGALKPQETARLMPALANNVLVVLLMQFLLGIGYIVEAVLL